MIRFDGKDGIGCPMPNRLGGKVGIMYPMSTFPSANIASVSYRPRVPTKFLANKYPWLTEITNQKNLNYVLLLQSNLS